MVVRFSALRNRPPLPPWNTPGNHSSKRLSRPQGRNAIGRILSMKIPVTPSGIEPATFRFVAQHLNRCVTAVPHSIVPVWYLVSTVRARWKFRMISRDVCWWLNLSSYVLDVNWLFVWMATECFLWVGTRFLDAFAKLRRVTVRFVMSVRLPACEISAQTGRGFVEFDTDFFFFSKICREDWTVIKIGQEKRALYTWRPIHILIVCHPFLLRARNVWGKSRENQNTHIQSSVHELNSFLKVVSKPKCS